MESEFVAPAELYAQLPWYKTRLILKWNFNSQVCYYSFFKEFCSRKALFPMDLDQMSQKSRWRWHDTPFQILVGVYDWSSRNGESVNCLSFCCNVRQFEAFISKITVSVLTRALSYMYSYGSLGSCRNRYIAFQFKYVQLRTYLFNGAYLRSEPLREREGDKRNFYRRAWAHRGQIGSNIKYLSSLLICLGTSRISTSFAFYPSLEPLLQYHRSLRPISCI